jgi:hypothetical protein
MHSGLNSLADRTALFQFLHGRGGYKGRVRGRVELEALLRELPPQAHGVHQVAVVGDGDVELAAAVELGLGVLPRRGAGGRVPDVTQGDMPGLERGEPRLVEDLGDEAHVTHGRRPLAVGDGYPG